MKDLVYCNWQMFDKGVQKLIEQIQPKLRKYNNIYAIPRGGLCLGVALSHQLGLPLLSDSVHIFTNTLVCDDITDSGKTLEKITNDTVTLFSTEGTELPTYWAYKKKESDWIYFPWENYQQTLIELNNSKVI